MCQVLFVPRDRLDPGIVSMKGPHLLLGQVLDVDETIAGALDRGHELVQLQMDSLRVLVLGALNQKDHQEGHHRGPGVDDELPRVREPEQRPVSAQTAMVPSATPNAGEPPVHRVTR
jgi:hypothetical protein